MAIPSLLGYISMGNTKGLTDKMKRFCEERHANGGNAVRAYMSAYDTTNYSTAKQESYRLMKRDDIREYIQELERPHKNVAQAERKRIIDKLWSIIDSPNSKDTDRLSAINIYNKMNGLYTDTTEAVTDKELESVTTDKLLKLLG